MTDFLKTTNFAVAVALLIGVGLATLYHEIERRRAAPATETVAPFWYVKASLGDYFDDDDRKILYGKFDTKDEAEQTINKLCEMFAGGVLKSFVCNLAVLKAVPVCHEPGTGGKPKPIPLPPIVNPR